jgi:hypothetical protein
MLHIRVVTAPGRTGLLLDRLHGPSRRRLPGSDVALVGGGHRAVRALGQRHVVDGEGPFAA